MKTPDLKPCPFCGGEAVLEELIVRKGFEAIVKCIGDCLAEMRTITYETKEDAVEAAVKDWNRRVKDGEN